MAKIHYTCFFPGVSDETINEYQGAKFTTCQVHTFSDVSERCTSTASHTVTYTATGKKRHLCQVHADQHIALAARSQMCEVTK